MVYFSSFLTPSYLSYVVFRRNRPDFILNFAFLWARHSHLIGQTPEDRATQKHRFGPQRQGFEDVCAPPHSSIEVHLGPAPYCLHDLWQHIQLQRNEWRCWAPHCYWELMAKFNTRTPLIRNPKAKTPWDGCSALQILGLWNCNCG